MHKQTYLIIEMRAQIYIESTVGWLKKIHETAEKIWLFLLENIIYSCHAEQRNRSYLFVSINCFYLMSLLHGEKVS